MCRKWWKWTTVIDGAWLPWATTRPTLSSSSSSTGWRGSLSSPSTASTSCSTPSSSSTTVPAWTSGLKRLINKKESGFRTSPWKYIFQRELLPNCGWGERLWKLWSSPLPSAQVKNHKNRFFLSVSALKSLQDIVENCMFIVEFIALRLHCHLSTGSSLQRGTQRKSGKTPKCLTDTHLSQPPLYHLKNLLHPQEEHQPQKPPLSISSSPPFVCAGAVACWSTATSWWRTTGRPGRKPSKPWSATCAAGIYTHHFSNHWLFNLFAIELVEAIQEECRDALMLLK